MLEKEVIIVNKLGLHARAAAQLVQLAAQFEAHIEVHQEAHSVNAKSIMGLLLLAAGKGTNLRLSAEGSDQEAALSALVDLFQSGFGESE